MSKLRLFDTHTLAGGKQQAPIDEAESVFGTRPAMHDSCSEPNISSAKTGLAYDKG